MEWFYYLLGIDDMYFKSDTAPAIASDIVSLYAAKVAAHARDDKWLDIKFDRESDDHAVYVDASQPGMDQEEGPRYEQRIDEKYLSGSEAGKVYRVEFFQSTNPLPIEDLGNDEQSFSYYFVYECRFKNPKPGPEVTSIDELGDNRFLERSTLSTQDLYKEILNKAVGCTGPLTQIFDIQDSREKRLVIAYRQGSATGLFSSLSDLAHYYGLVSSRKYVEQFSNGITIMSIYLRPSEQHEDKHPPIETSIHQIMKEVSLLYCLPRNKFRDHFIAGRLSLQETVYAHCVWVFVQQFLNRLGPEYTSLSAVLDSSNSSHQQILSNIKRRLTTETFSSDYLLEIINKYPDLVRSLYLAFANVHGIHNRKVKNDFIATMCSSRPRTDLLLDDLGLGDLISKVAHNEHDAMVMNAFRAFNATVLKTNFYTPTKVALSFRFEPSFLPQPEYPQPLYGMFAVIGPEFRGYHLRFRDIARGGIRIVKSHSEEAHQINTRLVFDENYNLALTQQKKNKDIPEGGSKGVILLDFEHQDKSRIAFEKYVDSILDLLLPAASPGTKDPIVDLYGHEEILFMGPDENTADLVDW